MLDNRRAFEDVRVLDIACTGVVDLQGPKPRHLHTKNQHDTILRLTNEIALGTGGKPSTW